MADQVVTVVEDSITLIESAPQGPPGPAGVSSDAPTITLPASAAMSGHRAIRSAAGLAAYADAAAPGDANLAIGISRNAAILGDQVVIQTGGLMTEPSWSWTPDHPVFCGPAGSLTQTAPAIGFAQVMAIAMTSTQIHIGAKMPISLT